MRERESEGALRVDAADHVRGSSAFDERLQALGRVVPLCRDLVEVPVCSSQAFGVPGTITLTTLF
jgi:hypothetical protein